MLCDLVPGGHQKEISAAQAARILERVTPSGAVARARCELAAEFLRERRGDVLRASEADVSAATGRLDEGALDRLRLDDDRIEAIALGLEATAELAPIDREVRAWTLPNGLRVSERLVPIGVVGANFEARPNVAVDVAGQLLKSLNAAVLRTGGAALRTVTVLVDEVLRGSGTAVAGLAARRSAPNGLEPVLAERGEVDHQVDGVGQPRR